MIRKTFMFIIVILVYFVDEVCSVCEKTNRTTINCEYVGTLSQSVMERTQIDFGRIRELSIKNNSSHLEIISDTFARMVNLEYVSIDSTKLNTLFSRTFSNLPLKRIRLSYNEIEKIHEGAFSNLTRLNTILLRHNRLQNIQRGIFINLPVVTLTFSHNMINSIEDLAFDNLSNLKKLHLDNNRLSSTYPHKYLSDPENLEILWLYNNTLKLITANMLSKLSKLRVLNLGFNKIETIEEDAFGQTPLLDTLVLSFNQLKTIDGNVFPKKGTENLVHLYLDNNKLMFLTSKFFLRLKNLHSITLVGNPWLCQCLLLINRLIADNNMIEKCNEQYLDGNRPSCVAEKSNDQKCHYVYNNDLGDKFFEHMETYPIRTRKLPCFL